LKNPKDIVFFSRYRDALHGSSEYGHQSSPTPLASQDGYAELSTSPQDKERGHRFSGQHSDDLWPTETSAFQRDIRRIAGDVKLTVQVSSIFTVCMWFVMCMWALLECDLDSLNVSSILWNFAKTQEVDVNWPEPLFKPEKIACDGELRQVFLANKFRIYTATRDMLSNRLDKWQHLPCDIGSLGTIEDLTVYCGQGGRLCRPLVLVRRSNASTVVVDCLQQEVSGGHGAVQNLRLRVGKAEFAAVDSSSNLMMVGQGQEMVVYGPAINGSREPLHDFVLEAGNIVSVDYSDDWVFVFSNVRKGLSTRAIQVRSSSSLVLYSEWGISHGIMPLRGGCGADSGLEALVLNRPYQLGSLSRLFHLQRR